MNFDEKQAIKDLQTIRDLVRWGFSCFSQSDIYYGHGTDNAMDEIFSLVMHALHLPHDCPDAYLDCRLTLAEKEQIVHWIQRRISERIPSAYLTHEAWFANLPFFVDERVLVPRSPIAELIETSFSPWLDPDHVHSVLDLCTGSACIAIACAYAFPGADIDAVDLSVDALDVARINIEKHGVQEQVHAIESDVFDALSDRTYDLIVSNPPYVSQLEMQSLPAEYTHEPQMGLVAGVQGLDIVDRILKQAAGYLTPQGVLIVEVGNTQSTVEQAYPELPFLWLDFSRGGEGVFMLTREQLDTWVQADE